MNLIKKGSRGPTVKSIQLFLTGYGCNLGKADSIFGNATEKCVKKYQKNKNIKEDGIIGNTTLGYMLRDGLALLPDTSDFPPKPDFPALSSAQRAEIFGRFKYVAAPTSDNPEGIKILGNWESENIVSVDLPQLSKATNGQYTRMRFHKLAADQLRALWSDWEKAGLLHLIKSYDGAFYPRFVRGSRTSLSNHSFGTAFDICYYWNKLGTIGAQVGEEGSVRELIPLATKNGFFWGFWFSRKDPMHIELGKIL